MYILTVLTKMPIYLNAYVRTVAAEDVGLAHVRALERSDITVGQRYMIVENTYRMEDLIMIMKDSLSGYGYRFGYTSIPMILQNAFLSVLKIMGIKFNPGPLCYFDNTKSKEELGLRYMEVHKYLTNALFC